MIRGGGAQALREMGRLERMIERLSTVPRNTAKLAEPKINRLIQEQFRNGTDPYGRPWAALQPSTIARGRKAPPLTDTRKLRNGTKVRPSSGGAIGLTMVVGAPYGRFHQTGTRYMKARRILPQNGLPAQWRIALLAASRKACQDVSAALSGGGSE